MFESYFQQIYQLLQKVEEKERKPIVKAAEKLASTIQTGGVIHLFGCGHSHILAEELYYRAGGLVPIHPILPQELMLHQSAVRASELERKTDYAQKFMEKEDIRNTDSIIVFSTSGRNPVPIDVALFAKQKGAYTIGISSTIYATKQPSRHPSGHYLKDVVDLIIDNHIPFGDALLTHELVSIPFAPGSTVISAAITNSIIAQTIVILAEAGIEPPIFKSANIDGADEHNHRLLDAYKNRNKC